MTLNVTPTQPRSRRDRSPTSGLRRFSSRFTALAILTLLASSFVAIAGAQDSYTPADQGSCAATSMNMQCSAFGTIQMDARRDIRGEPINVTTHIDLNTAYADQGARWVMFSVRNVTDDGASPVTIRLDGFATASGAIVVTRTEQPKPSELNLWVDVLDLPLHTPISLDLTVGSTDRGAFSLETLVLAFDRGYAPIKDSQGKDASLFSFTLLGVNKETEAVGNPVHALINGHKLPTPGLVEVIGVLVVASAVVYGRRKK